MKYQESKHIHVTLEPGDKAYQLRDLINHFDTDSDVEGEILIRRDGPVLEWRP